MEKNAVESGETLEVQFYLFVKSVRHTTLLSLDDSQPGSALGVPGHHALPVDGSGSMCGWHRDPRYRPRLKIHRLRTQETQNVALSPQESVN